MPNPVIILGAGASHDYIHSDDLTRGSRFIPPLTNSVFNVKLA